MGFPYPPGKYPSLSSFSSIASLTNPDISGIALTRASASMGILALNTLSANTEPGGLVFDTYCVSSSRGFRLFIAVNWVLRGFSLHCNPVNRNNQVVRLRQIVYN